MKKYYCPGDCDFGRHFVSQAGQGYSSLNVYRGIPYQRGHGFGSFFSRFAVPIAKFFGRQLLKTGVAVGGDILDNKSPKEALKNRLQETTKSVIREGWNKANEIVQRGTGRKRVLKRKPTRKRKPARKRKPKRKPKKKSQKRQRAFKRDIFS